MALQRRVWKRLISMGHQIKKRFLVIIPARCGSKGIRFKNIADLNGYPLIYYTIEVAKKLKAENIVDDIFISTDCLKIKQICEKFKVKVEKLRDKSLSGDDVKTIDLIYSILHHYKINNISFENFIILQPTSPLRTYNQVYKSIKMYIKHNSNSLISVYKDSTLSDEIIYHKDGINFIPKNKNHSSGIRRQENKLSYIRNGAIYITKVKFFMQKKSLICSNPIGFVMDKITSINIDGEIDLEIARRLI